MNQNPSCQLVELVLAALFHDLGKFGQRAGADRSDSLISTYCPTFRGRSSHFHVLNTDHFIENILPIPQGLNLDRSQIATMAAKHHRPDLDNLSEACLVVADHLASGADRWKDEEEEEVGEDYIGARLISIFEELELDRHHFDYNNCRRYPLEPIDGESFPKQGGALPRREGRAGYLEQWNRFAEHLTNPDENSVLRHPDLPLHHYLDSLCTALERYLWCVPAASYKTIPDISLHDHGILTASLAQSLYCYHLEMGTSPSSTKEDRTANKFLIFGGDLSGIQNYIFGLNPDVSSGMAKLFRARSFCLQMVTKVVVAEILNLMGLTSVAKVMDAGGRFWLVLPNTPTTHKKLKSFLPKLEREFLNRFLGTVALNISLVEASFEDLLLPSFPAILDQVIEGMEEAKLTRFSRIISKKDWGPVFQEWAPEGEGQRTGVNEFESGGEEINPQLFRQLRRLATDLADPDRRWFKLFQEGEESNEVELIFGWKVALLSRMPDKEDWNAGVICNRFGYGDYGLHPVAGHLPRVEQSDLERWSKDQLLRMSEDDKEVEEGDPKTFSMLARSGETAGQDYLGVFKADVDNLGLLFSRGLCRERSDGSETRKISISRFASMSRMLNHYFSQSLLQNLILPRYPDLYVVFSGGDDLFFLGPWVQVIRFGVELRSDFSRFVADNSDITISAGIGVFRPTLPIRELERRTDQLLDRSKEYQNGNDIKNAVTLFDDTVPWPVFQSLISVGDWLSDEVRAKRLNTGFLHRLLRYGRQARRVEEGDTRAAIYRSHLSYDLARNLENRLKDYPETWKRLNKWLISEEFRKHSSIPLHYALYRNR